MSTTLDVVAEPNVAGAARERLRDGRLVELALIGSADRDDLRAGFEGLSPRSRYLRFFSSMPRLPDFIVDGLLRTDGHSRVAVGARLVDEHGVAQPPIVGVARYFRSGAGAVAEPAVAVVDSLHGLGLGKLLLRRLSRIARRRGITRFRAHALADNTRIRAMLRASNGVMVEQDGPVLVYDIDIDPRQPRRRGVMRRILRAMLGR